MDFKKFKKESKSDKLDEEAKRLLERLKTLDPESEAYKLVLEKAEKIFKLRQQENKVDKIDIGQIFGSAVTLLSILSILNYEQANIITSKAFGIFMKGVGK